MPKTESTVINRKNSMKPNNKDQTLKTRPESPLVSRKNSTKMIRPEKISNIAPFSKKGQ